MTEQASQVPGKHLPPVAFLRMLSEHTKFGRLRDVRRQRKTGPLIWVVALM